MDKKVKIILGVAVAVVALVIGFLLYTMRKQMLESQQMLELAEMDKREMENEYEQFAMQYNEMKTQINNDSLVAQLEMEQKRTEELLEELRRVKSNDAAEIMRLKKELATLRQVLRSYVLQIDSLNRMNEALAQENSNLKTQNQQAQQQKEQPSKEQLKDAVTKMNKKMENSEAIFGIHDGTNRITIKIVDKDTKKVIKELPPEKTLDMIAKVWEMAGLLVDEKR